MTGFDNQFRQQASWRNMRGITKKDEGKREGQ